MDPGRLKRENRVKIIPRSIIHFIGKVLKDWFGRKAFCTLVVVPHTPMRNVRTIKFSKRFISILVLLNIAALVIVCTFAISYHSLEARLQGSITEYRSLQYINEDNEQQLSQYKSKEDQLKQEIQEMENLKNKLDGIIDSAGKSQASSGGSSIASRTASVPHPRIKDLPDGTNENIGDLISSAETLKANVNSSIQEFNDAIKRAEEAAMAARARPSVLPAYGIITSLFGYRKDPILGSSEFHTGIDISNKIGTPIRASGDGVVTKAGWDSGYGNLIIINHQNGYESLYGHNSKIVVKVGQHIKRGDVIGYMGSTGRTTGTHCHFEVRYNGTPVNPYSIK